MVEVNNLSFAYKKQPLFNNLTLQLDVGNIYGLFGLNGAGKTTLLNIISGLLFPQKGGCRLLGQPTAQRRVETLRNIYVLPEKFSLPDMKPNQYVTLHAPFYPDFDESYYQELINSLKINTEKKLKELSFGQRKKFLICFGLATNCRLLLMDEPTNGLDIPSKSQFRKIIAAADNSERCIVISTHQVRDLESLIDHLTVLNDGQIIFQQSLEEISNALGFEEVSDNELSDALYSEEIFGGHKAILPKERKNKDTQVDLELLFNGIIEQSETINKAFK